MVLLFFVCIILMSIETENNCNYSDFYVVCVHGNIGAGKSTFIEK